MRRLAHSGVRPVAGILMLVLLVVFAAAECMTAAMTPEQHACCAAMKGACEMSISSPCCATETHHPQGIVAMKPTVEVIPAAVLVGVLSAPPVVLSSATHLADAPDASAAGPPGVPTYLFVSSFRI